MHTYKHRFVAFDIPLYNSHMFQSVALLTKWDKPEMTELGWQIYLFALLAVWFAIAFIPSLSLFLL